MSILDSDGQNINAKERHKLLCEAAENAQTSLKCISSMLCLVLEQMEENTFAYSSVEGLILLADYETKNLSNSI